MKIIPIHHTKSKPVTSKKDLADVAEMLALIHSTFPGNWPEGFALSHAQVSAEPFAFFVLNSKVKESFGGHDVIVNLRILEKDDPVQFKEACLSFPFRPVIKTRRFERVLVEFETPRKLLPGLTTVRMELTGIAAFIAQHELDHARGVNIYGK